VKISILVATKNRPEFIKWWTRDIAKQTRQPDEILVVDTTGPDRTDDVFRGLGDLSYSANIQVFNEDPLWDTGQSRQKLLDECTGDVCMWWDDDDWHHRLYLETVEYEFNKCHTNVIGFPTIYNLDCHTKKVYQTGNLVGGPIWPAGIVISTDLMKRVALPARPKKVGETLGREVGHLTEVMTLLANGQRDSVRRITSLRVPYIIFIHGKNVWGSTDKWESGDQQHEATSMGVEEFLENPDHSIGWARADEIRAHIKEIRND